MNTLDQDHYYLESYAQNREDLYIRAIFGEAYKGFYIDVGSNHPIHHSVTKLLYKSGWHGINIDPNQELIELTTYDRQRDIQLCCGVSSKAGKLTLRLYHNHGLSTFSSKMKKAYSHQSSGFTDTYTDVTVEVRTLADICEEQKITSIDLLKVDAEGYEQEVLEGNDWQRFRPKLICIEANHKSADWDAYLRKQGYQKKTTDGLNDYYVDAACELADTPVQFAETALVYPHIVDNEVAGYIALQKLRVETNDILHKAMRPPSRKASVRLLKESVRQSLQELKYLVKEHDKSPRTAYTPARIVDAPTTVNDTLSAYVQSMQKIYRQSFVHIWQYEQSLIPKTKTKALMKRAKLAGYDTPRLVLGEVGKVAHRRLK